MSQAFNKFDAFTKACGDKKHNLSADSLKLALCSVAPIAANAILADLTQISYTNLSSRVVTTTSFNTSGGVAKLILADLVLTAGGGSVASFRYVVLYNDTAANDELIGWWDNGSAVVLNDTDTFTTDFDATNGVLQIA